jgi:hypothetical protein
LAICGDCWVLAMGEGLGGGSGKPGILPGRLSGT